MTLRCYYKDKDKEVNDKLLLHPTKGRGNFILGVYGLRSTYQQFGTGNSNSLKRGMVREAAPMTHPYDIYYYSLIRGNSWHLKVNMCAYMKIKIKMRIFLSF